MLNLKNSFGFHFPKTAANAEPVVYDLYPTYNDAAWNATWKGTYQPCEGPFGTLLDHKDEAVAMKGHRWHEEGMALRYKSLIYLLCNNSDTIVRVSYADFRLIRGMELEQLFLH